MRRLLRPFLDRPRLTALGLVALLLLGVLGDLLRPVVPLLPVLAVLALLSLVAGLVLARRKPEAAWPLDLLTLAALLLIGFLPLAVLPWLAGAPRGVLAGLSSSVASFQQGLLGGSAVATSEAERLRDALERPDPAPLARPASADGFLYNAILLRQREDEVGAARALAEALQREPAPRPDALLLHDALLGTGRAEVIEALGSPPDTLAAEAKAHLAAMRLPEGRERLAALARLVAAEPEALVSAAALARGLAAAATPPGPTVAAAARIAAAVDAFEDEERFPAFAARFLQPAAAARLQSEVLALAGAREVAARQITFTTQAPPPGQPNAPLLLRVIAPEPAQSVQYLRGQDAEGPVWAEIAQRQGDPAPTLRINRPFRTQELRFRYVDRDGVTSAPMVHEFDPAAAFRDQAQRTLQRLSPFAGYQPVRGAGGRLPPITIPGPLRAGLIAVEWATDAERRPTVVPVGVPDEQLLAGDPPRTQVAMVVPAAARQLLLTAVFADGSRSATVELQIR